MRMVWVMLFVCFTLSGCTLTVDNGNETENEGEENLNLQKDEIMSVEFIDVGQGDSIFIQSPDGNTMLIDGGTRGAGGDVVDYLKENNIKQLDYVVATHPDADHIGGLIRVLESMSVNHFIDSGKIHTSETYKEMLTLIQTKNISFHVPQIDDTIPLDDALEITVLQVDEEASDNNEASIVLKVEYENVSLLLTGDAGIEMEQQMIDTQNVGATILKAGHHGSNTSSSKQFIEAVNPEVTILSYGQGNSYGHPHYEVIQNLQQIGSKIYATAQSGDIKIETDGIQYHVLAEEWKGTGISSSLNPKTTTAEKIIIDSKDLEGEIVSIQNSGTTPVHLEGWQLISLNGNQVFNFPNITLDPEEKLYITSGSEAKEGRSYIKWTGRQIWLNSGDAAQLINPKGEIVSEVE